MFHYSHNNFDFFRIFLAVTVFFYHVDELTGVTNINFLPTNFAVQSFFVVSGFLIAKSYLRNPNLKAYFLSRFFRVVPLYSFVVFVVFLVAYFSVEHGFFDFINSGGLRYLFYNLIFLNFMEPSLPGLFENLRNTAVNGSLWTIKVEIMFYIFLPLMFSFGFRFISPLKLIFLIFIFSCFFNWLMNYFISNFGWNQSLNNQLPTFLAYFIVGVSFNYFHGLEVKYPKLILILCLVFFYFPINIFLHPLLVGLFVYIFSFSIPFLKVSESVGDLSYGIYIWHFPVIQFYLYFNLFDSVFFGVIMCVLSVFIVSFLSWHFLEKPIMNRVKNYLRKI